MTEFIKQEKTFQIKVLSRTVSVTRHPATVSTLSLSHSLSLSFVWIKMYFRSLADADENMIFIITAQIFRRFCRRCFSSLLPLRTTPSSSDSKEKIKLSIAHGLCHTRTCHLLDNSI